MFAAMISCRTRDHYFIYNKIFDLLLLTFRCRFHNATRYMKYFRQVILSGEKFVPQGNYRTNRIREKDKRNRPWHGKRPISGKTRNQSNTRKEQRQIRQQPCALEGTVSGLFVFVWSEHECDQVVSPLKSK